jgi:hypothetical protein
VSRRRHAPGRNPRDWIVSVFAKDGRLVFEAECENEKEIQALATEARSRGMWFRILITEPGRCGVRSWD